MTHYNSARQNSKDEDLESDCYWENASIVVRESTRPSKLKDLNQETMNKINSIKSDFEFQVNEDRICAQQKPTAYVKKLKPVLLLYIVSILCIQKPTMCFLNYLSLTYFVCLQYSCLLQLKFASKSNWIAAYTCLASLTNSQRTRKFKNISKIIKF